jgi:preprotein translocase subunit SecF
MQLLNNNHYDFLRWRWHAIVLSWVVILAGVGLMLSHGGPLLGIDFSGGTIVITRFHTPVSEEAVRAALDSVPGEKVVQSYGDPKLNEVLVRRPQTKQAAGFGLEREAKEVVDALKAAKLPDFEILSQEVVGPVVGEDLKWKGVAATILSILGIGAYIWFRFRLSFAMGAMVATFHDILVTIAFLEFFKFELSLNIVAAILTIAGYSVNDTIVIFDRVRENTHSARRRPLYDVINESINQTMSRTIITAGTTFLAVFSLFVFGGEVLRGFAFTMLVGIICGTYSTIFIASAVAVVMGTREEKRLAASASAAKAAPAAPAARTKSNRKANAS